MFQNHYTTFTQHILLLWHLSYMLCSCYIVQNDFIPEDQNFIVITFLTFFFVNVSVPLWCLVCQAFQCLIFISVVHIFLYRYKFQLYFINLTFSLNTEMCDRQDTITELLNGDVQGGPMGRREGRQWRGQQGWAMKIIHCNLPQRSDGYSHKFSAPQCTMD